MKIMKKIIITIVMMALLGSLTACKDSSSKLESNVDAYMKNLKQLTVSNYVEWVSENLYNPYQEMGLDLSQLKEGQITYFIECLSKMEYEIVSVDETNKVAEVNVTYVDSTEYVTNIFAQLLAYVFSEDYSEEGQNQIYLDVMNAIEEYRFVSDVLYFSLKEDNTIESVSSNAFDVVTADFYKVMIGGSSETEGQGAKYTAEELLNNIEINYEVQDENMICVTISNHNEVAVSPIVYFNFKDSDGNVVICSQAYIEALPAGATNYTYAYNELGYEGAISFDTEIEVEYYNAEDITFFDESLVPYEIKQVEDEVDISFTNNTGETINICGGYFAYNKDGEVIMMGDICIYDLAPGESDNAWFYLSSEYDENTDTWIVDSYEKIEVYPIAHTNASAIWCN